MQWRCKIQSQIIQNQIIYLHFCVFLRVGVPPRASSQAAEYSVIHGLRAAIEALAEPTDFQKEQIIASKTENCKLINRGRVICITSARDDAR